MVVKETQIAFTVLVTIMTLSELVGMVGMGLEMARTLGISGYAVILVV